MSAPIINQARADRFRRLVRDERVRQDKLWGTDSPGLDKFLTILTEEVGEVARAINDGAYRNLEVELSQVAAVAQRIFEQALELRERCALCGAREGEEHVRRMHAEVAR